MPSNCGRCGYYITQGKAIESYLDQVLPENAITHFYDAKNRVRRSRKSIPVRPISALNTKQWVFGAALCNSNFVDADEQN